MKFIFYLLIGTLANFCFSQSFSYSGYVLNSDGSPVSNIAVGFSKQTNPNFSNQLSSPQYFGNHTYYESLIQLNWLDAKRYCDSLGGHLVTITDMLENSFVNSYFNLNTYWLGISDSLVEGTWECVTGEILSYTNFQGNNNNTSKNFSYIASNGNWQYDNELTLRYFIIEIETPIYYIPTSSIEWIYTDTNGRFEFWNYYLFGDQYQININVPVVTNSYDDTDAIIMNERVLEQEFNSLDYYIFDVNNDGNISISDVYYLYMKMIGVFPNFPSGIVQTRIFPEDQFLLISNSYNDLRGNYTGDYPILTDPLINGGSSNFYTIATGFGDPSRLIFYSPM